jgi:phosphatidylserine/phosphatidylglycerophosphate/cardiolipin synthase-like enzyme
MGKGRVSLRSMLKLINFKANHRKIIITEKSLLVTSANPHNASSAHWNMALRVDGSGQALAAQSESAILNLSGKAPFQLTKTSPEKGDIGIELLTEYKIKEAALRLINQTPSGSRIDLTMFYLADNNLINALISAKQRGCRPRVILDPNKDAFGRIKNGIPNRQSAERLVKEGIPVRWADTHGEQCHIKTLYAETDNKTATLLLGSANFTRRNLDNFNAECDLACTTLQSHETMKKAREAFDRWWNNPNGKIFTADYKTYRDPSPLRKIKARLMEATGLSSF